MNILTTKPYGNIVRNLEDAENYKVENKNYPIRKK